MLNRSPTKIFNKVDFPTFGQPMMFTKPDLCTEFEIVLNFICLQRKELYLCTTIKKRSF